MYRTYYVQDKAMNNFMFKNIEKRKLQKRWFYQYLITL